MTENFYDSWRVYVHQYRGCPTRTTGRALTHSYVILDPVGNCLANIPGTEPRRARDEARHALRRRRARDGARAGARRRGGIDELHAFLDGAKNGRATFRQTVVARARRAPQASSGTFAFARPGKFRWSYEKPYEQLVVGDGAKVWVYDQDLNQVIVRKLDAALGATPAALLAGDNALETQLHAGRRRRRRRPRVGRGDAEGRRSRRSRRCASASAASCRARWSSTTRSARRRACTFDAFERNVGARRRPVPVHAARGRGRRWRAPRAGAESAVAVVRRRPVRSAHAPTRVEAHHGSGDAAFARSPCAARSG